MYINKICLLLLVSFGLRMNGWSQSVTKSGIIYTATGENTASVTGVSSTSRLVGSKTIESQIGISGKSRQVTAISFQAFANQKYLRKLILPEQLDSIGMEAFIGCLILQEIGGLSNVSHVGSYAFAGTALEGIDMSGWKVKSMGSGIFSGCTSLKQAKLPTILKTLPARTFSKCSALEQTNLAELTTLTEIGEGAFAGCSNLSALTLPESVATLQSFAFDGMSSLISLELPESLVCINDYAFRGCSALTALTLPEKLADLGLSPFYGCSALKQVSLSRRLKSISENYVFDNCQALESIDIPLQNTLYSSVDGVLYNRTKTQIVAWPAGLSRRVHPVVPSSSAPFAKGALLDCELDAQLWLPARMTTLPFDALTRTSGMKGLATEQGSMLSTIEARAVSNSKDLEVIDLPATLRRIGEAAFLGCTAIGDVITKSSTAPSVHISSFDEDTYGEACLHVREGVRTAFTSHSVWGRFVSIVDDALATDLLPISAETGETPVCDLSGRRISHVSTTVSHPLQKGIYIIGGRKVIK